VLFLNNAINHGVFTPLGAQQVQQSGKSILFLLEANPGPGLGILLLHLLRSRNRAGQCTRRDHHPVPRWNHEIYFPYVLMKPILIIGAIAGGMTGVAINVAFATGLRGPRRQGRSSR